MGINKLIYSILVTGIVVASAALIIAVPTEQAIAQSGGIVWNAPINISNSPDSTSTDPFLIADQTGKVHLFWAEKKSSIEGNQPDTLMYATWDGKVWSKPIDIFFSPESDGTPIVAYPRAVIDERGYLHLIWLAQPNFPRYALYYSSVYLPRANDVRAWRPKVVLASDLTGTKYSADIAYNPEQGLHVLYARVEQGFNPSEERAVSHIDSSDHGQNWSEPTDIYTISDLQGGASDVRLLLEPPANIYASWTQWDVSGNGQSIVFSRSLDNGQTWEAARKIARRIGNEYERDWNNMALLGPGQIVTMFEGGWRAYRNAMYSYDGGQVWTDPIDTFPWLIGENGSVEYARDGAGVLHLFIAQRVREGYSEYGDTDREGLWHSVWEGSERWSEPTLSNGLNAMINPKVVIAKGNLVVATWYAPPDFEIFTMIGKIAEAPEVEPITWPPEIIPTPTDEPTLVIETTVNPESTQISVSFANDESANVNTNLSPALGITAGLVTSIIVILIIAFVVIVRQK